ncbi:MAG: VOC family protein [Oligoflexia bacterium]|nr:VOC family protein [Oligoflexia bacterium]
MKFGYAIAYVENVPETVEFYEKAFGLERLFIHESNGYAEMNTGTTKLAFVSFELAKSNGPEFSKFGRPSTPPPFEIALVTENVGAAFERALSQGAAQVMKPVQKPWGQEVGYVKDCNGFLVEICSPMG